MKKGFTLAEVLITLAVIGVVAALTIPVLVQKYQKKQLYSQFMKAYNTISTMMDNAVAENGDIQNWKWGKIVEDDETGEARIEGSEDPISKYILPQIKYVKKCDKMADCFGTGYTYLNGKDGSSPEHPEDTLTNALVEADNDDINQYTTVVLADGTVISMIGDKDAVNFLIDTNGKKGPNVQGRDYFNMYYESEKYDHPGLYFIAEWDPNGPNGDNCNPNSNSEYAGDGCESRLLQEGAMNY